ncbi:lysosomal acid lipase/cholesteryl ester hydrolase-like [Ixodes scapularis]|uniref:lysosomal acid lipase/cholesteryl ester hydrolase-like n=1 Tax=Ixodes scapularis TaxID=6945 RepID=UPI001C387C9C|nr:lysosomal acid lipase/cholesteryl ester hydrolase-like [Ixodes scapularis]
MKSETIQVLLTLLASAISTGVGSLLSFDPDVSKNVSELIWSKGYPVEEYNVITTDGYILSIQRIPWGRNEDFHNNFSAKVPVFLVHGLFGSSADFVMNFERQNIAFILADAGFDVWLGNYRGNTYTNHVSLSRDDKSFYADQIISYDIPATINAVLKISGQQKMQYIGWSQGTQVLFGLLSEKPEYNDKPMLNIIGHGALLPRSCATKELAKLFCSDNLTGPVCETGVFLIADVDSKELNKSRLPVYLEHTPSGTSVDNLYGLMQITPPRYDLSKVTIPVALYWSKGDWWADEKDVERLRWNLKHVVAFNRVFDEDFTHLDFAWGIRSTPVLYGKMLGLMRSYVTT